MADKEKGMSRKYFGIVICILFAIMYILVESVAAPYFEGAIWYCTRSALRVLFFIVELFIFIRFYDKETAGNVIFFKGFKKGLFAGIAMFLFIPFVIITYFIVGAPEWADISISIVLSYLILEQLSVALFEEFTFRAFVMEGYFLEENKTVSTKIMYALISAVVFGIFHAQAATTMNSAIIRFVITGIWGFAFASVYIYSHNILAAMFIHFITDVVVNSTNLIKEWTPSNLMTILDNYVYFIVLGIILVTAAFFIIGTLGNEKDDPKIEEV